VNKNNNKEIIGTARNFGKTEISNTGWRQSSQSDIEFDREMAQFLATQYKNFFGKGANRYAIYPSYWKDSWGRAPLLGIVFADNEFLAEKLAYDKGILPTPFNCTFQPKIKNLGPNKNLNK